MQTLSRIFSDASIDMIWIGCLTIVVAVVEYCWPAGDQPTMLSRIQNIIIAFITMILLGFTFLVFTPVFEFLKGHGLLGLIRGTWRPTGIGHIGAILVYAFVWDFFQYWFHRSEHTFPFLWPVHALHHDEQHLNATTSQRNTFWSGVLHLAFVHIPTIIICGPDLITFYGTIVFFKMYGFFNHANVRISLGRLTPIFSGPQWHRLHHGRDSEFYNRNYAAFFPILDVMFGTYRRPAKDEYPLTGLVDRPQAPLGAMQILRDLFGIAERRVPNTRVAETA